VTVIDQPAAEPSTSPVPAQFERHLAEMGVIVVAAADGVAPAVVLPLDVATRFLQEAHAAQPRRYVTEADRQRLAAGVRAARYPDAA
jgi:hypothetical protein